MQKDKKIDLQQNIIPKDMNISKKTQEKANVIISFSSDEE